MQDAYNYNKGNKNLTILQLNIRSILGKQEDLNRLLSRLNNQNSLPKLLIISETHLNTSKLRHLNIPNYKILSRNRMNKPGGGVAILSHNTQPVNIDQILTNSTAIHLSAYSWKFPIAIINQS